MVQTMSTSTSPDARATGGPPATEPLDGARTAARRSSRLLQLGLVRSANAPTHIVTFVVAGVTTVIVTRLYLALAGYPQIGGGGLHIAHMLPGGLLMLVALFLLLVYVGPVVRPAAALLGGIGFGLFIDEVGKFVTSDNDYFFRPAPAIMYVVFAAVVLGVQALHDRRLDPRERLANAVDQAVEGVAGGLSRRRRADAIGQVNAAGPVEDAAVARAVRALVDACPDDNVEIPAPAERVRLTVRRGFERLTAKRWTGQVIVALLAAQVIGAVTVAVLSRTGGAGSWREVTFFGVAGGAAAAAGLTTYGARWLRTDRVRAVAALQLAVLSFLLVTRVFEFAHNSISATIGLVLDLVLLGLTATELNRLRR
jgi:hypothetical protein